MWPSSGGGASPPRDVGMIVAPPEQDTSAEHYVISMCASDPSDWKMYRIDQRAYVPRTNRTIDPAGYKNEVRRLDQKRSPTLTYGWTVSWDPREMDGNTILWFEKEREREVHAMELALRDIAVMEDCESGQIWTETFGWLPIDRKFASRIRPNVAVYCWVKLGVHPVLHDQAAYSFCDFDCVEPNIQSKIVNTPWNEANPKYRMRVYDSDDEEDPVERAMCRMVEGYAEKKAAKPQQLHSSEALAVGRYSLVSLVYPAYPMIVPLTKLDCAGNEQELVTGRPYMVNAFYCEEEKTMYVSSFRDCTNGGASIPSDPPKWGEDYGLLQLSLSPLGENKLGLFHHEPVEGTSQKYKLGYVDDPLGLLAMYHLTHLSSGKFKVKVRDHGYNKLARFRIEEADPVRMGKVHKEMDENEFVVERVDGYVVSGDGEQVFVAAHPTLSFIFSSEVCPTWKHFPAGTPIRNIVANHIKGTNKFAITSWKESEGTILDNISYMGRRAFCVTLRAGKGFRFTNECDAFGLVDDPSNQIDGELKKNQSITAWVMESRAGDDPKSRFRPSRTPFTVIKTGTAPPVDKYRGEMRAAVAASVRTEREDKENRQAAAIRVAGQIPSEVMSRFGGLGMGAAAPAPAPAAVPVAVAASSPASSPYVTPNASPVPSESKMAIAAPAAPVAPAPRGLGFFSRASGATGAFSASKSAFGASSSSSRPVSAVPTGRGTFGGFGAPTPAASATASAAATPAPTPPLSGRGVFGARTQTPSVAPSNAAIGFATAKLNEQLREIGWGSAGRSDGFRGVTLAIRDADLEEAERAIIREQTIEQEQMQQAILESLRPPPGFSPPPLVNGVLAPPPGLEPPMGRPPGLNVYEDDDGWGDEPVMPKHAEPEPVEDVVEKEKAAAAAAAACASAGHVCGEKCASFKILALILGMDGFYEAAEAANGEMLEEMLGYVFTNSK